MCDKILIFDSTKRKLQLIAKQKDELEIEILLPQKFKAMKKIFSEPNEVYYDDFTAKILDSMKIHYRKLVEKTIAENSYLVVTNEQDEIVRVMQMN